MTLTGALAKLQTFDVPVLRSADVAARLAVSPSNASQIMARLARHGYVVRIKRGLWAWARTDPTSIVAYLTAPFPAYVSLQSALYYHGMISQIPDVVYGVSLARTRRYRTALGTVSVHHLPARLFFGYAMNREESVAMATPEKALFDVFYLGSAKSRLFAALPELSLPAGFSRKRLARMMAEIPDPKRRAYVQARARTLLA